MTVALAMAEAGTSMAVRSPLPRSSCRAVLTVSLMLAGNAGISSSQVSTHSIACLYRPETASTCYAEPQLFSRYIMMFGLFHRRMNSHLQYNLVITVQQIELDQKAEWLRGVRQVPSPNQDERPEGAAIELLVIHGI